MTVNESKSESLRAKYHLEIEQLDYKFIRTCVKAKTIENILKVLRSGQEGIYPDLIRFTEDKLRTLKPNSSLLRTEQPATTLRALDSEVREELLFDLKQWKCEVSAADAELKSISTKKEDTDEKELPPVRGTVQLSTATAKEQKSPSQEKPGRIPSYDYASWDRYDVEAQLKLLEESDTPVQREPQLEHSDPAIDDQPPVEGLSQAERSALALRERQKGNEYFRSGDFSRAAVYYTRSINASPTVAAFNNRAQANLKLGKHGSALMDCGYVLHREPRNVKALLRRGIARQMNRDWIRARADFQLVLQIEQNNPQAKKHMEEVEKSIIGSETKRSKVLIQEVDSIEEENVETSVTANTVSDNQANAEKSDRRVDKDKESVCQIKNEQKEPGSAEKEKPNESTGIAKGGHGNKQPLIQEIDASDDRGEDVIINIIGDQRKDRKNNTDMNQTKGVSIEEAVVHHCTESSSSSCSSSSDAKTSKDRKGMGVIPPETREQDKSFTASLEPSTKLIKDSCVRRCPSPTQFPDSSAAPETASTEVRVSASSETASSGDRMSASSGDRMSASGVGVSAAPKTRRWRTFEFLREWRSVRRSGRGLAAYVALLRSVAPHQLAEVLGSELDSGILSTIIRCIQDVMLTEDGPEQCRTLLEHLSNVQRFHMMKLLLDAKDRQRLQIIAERLHRLGVDISLLTRRFLS